MRQYCLSLLLGLLLPLWLPAAVAANTAGASWALSSRASLDAKTPDRDYRADWTFEVSPQHDFMITLDEHYGARQRKGKLLVVAGQALLTHGLQLAPNAVMEAMDVPILTYKLALHLLAHAVPRGPGSVDQRQHFDVTERHQSIKLATATASTQYNPPWSVAGEVEPVANKDNTIHYQLDFTFEAGRDKAHQTTQHLLLNGVWEQNKATLDLPDSTSLAGWTLYHLGPELRGQAGGVRFGASPDKHSYQTLGDLRAALAH